MNFEFATKCKMVLTKDPQFDAWNLVLALWVFEKNLNHPNVHPKLHETYFLQHFTQLNYEIFSKNNIICIKNVNDR